MKYSKNNDIEIIKLNSIQKNKFKKEVSSVIKKAKNTLGSEIFNFTNSLKLLLGKKIRIRAKLND